MQAVFDTQINTGNSASPQSQNNIVLTKLASDKIASLLQEMEGGNFFGSAYPAGAVPVFSMNLLLISKRCLMTWL